MTLRTGSLERSWVFQGKAVTHNCVHVKRPLHAVLTPCAHDFHHTWLQGDQAWFLSKLKIHGWSIFDKSCFNQHRPDESDMWSTTENVVSFKKQITLYFYYAVLYIPIRFSNSPMLLIYVANCLFFFFIFSTMIFDLHPERSICWTGTA